ncbi:hypothetical protein BO99DRAFT_427837 [Aspergillus violaceofuscus CBS 115571]|uniref:Uncharacterized protein n=1 Tax=Aspergillus violaceofuscus (strain CBS 115571) TaxID=1450538 RepID=A0A2V5HQ89_ASPV1|nr:hypothetical protein BO99DRAFT_427837 [Aspergillus violaceofuscus CBS 115571]
MPATQQIFVNAGGRATIRQARKGLESKTISGEALLREAERLERAAAAEEAEVRRKREKAAELRQKAEALSKGEDMGVVLALRVKEASENDAKME